MRHTPLHDAALNGNTAMVEFLMANFNTNLDAKDLVSYVHRLLLCSQLSSYCGCTAFRRELVCVPLCYAVLNHETCSHLRLLLTTP